MIAWLQGILLEKEAPQVVINVNGVGYLVETSLNTFFKLPDLNESLSIFIYQVVREDALLLYGFYDKAERAMFRLLIKVNGIGPKLALTILSSIEAGALADCILLKDVGALKKLPGIGKKTAERLMMEMQDKVVEWNQSFRTDVQSNIILKTPLSGELYVQDAVSALIALGYKSSEAANAVKVVNQEDNKTSQQLIREALKYLSQAY